VEQDKRPDKKVYAITAAGRARLVADLIATEGRHRVRSEFLVLMSFAHLLPPAKVEAVLDTMIANFERWLAEGLDPEAGDGCGCFPSAATPGVRFARGYGRAVLSAAVDFMKTERDPFLAELRAKQGPVAAAAEIAA
jgi:PadR family transcriptional regulator AphA